jgi:hypothetical protein
MLKAINYLEARKSSTKLRPPITRKQPATSQSPEQLNQQKVKTLLRVPLLKNPVKSLTTIHVLGQQNIIKVTMKQFRNIQSHQLLNSISKD